MINKTAITEPKMANIPTEKTTNKFSILKVYVKLS